MINLLSIAVRMLTLLEFVVRRQLKQNQEQLTGLIPNNPHKAIDNPTTERLLNAFGDISLTIVHLPDQVIRHVTPLTTLAIRILAMLKGLHHPLHPSGGNSDKTTSISANGQVPIIFTR